MICDRLSECVKKELAGQHIASCSNSSVKCIEVSDRRSNVKCEERRKRYILENTKKNHVILYKVDGGVVLQDKTVPQGMCRCDYLFVIHGETDDAVLTELKGVDVTHSLKQIDETLTQYKSVLSQFAHVYGRVIVASLTPDIKAKPAYVNLVRKLRNRYKGNLKIVKIQFAEKDIELSK